MIPTAFGLDRFRRGPNLRDFDPDTPEKFREAPLYAADEELRTVVELALELGQPLLITGEPGCGKTAAAYWAAWELGLGPTDLFHVQIRSAATAADLKYEFDSVGFLRESQAAGARQEIWDTAHEEAVRRRLIRKGPLWHAFQAARERSVVLLLDEIDKAPRDFPNDLLHEFDQHEFDVPEWQENGRPLRVSARAPDRSARRESSPAQDPFLLVVFTSNGERRLPDAFLRRCVHHHVAFDEQRLLDIVRYRLEQARRDEHRAGSGGDGVGLGDDFVRYAIKRFMVLKRSEQLNHEPGLAELLVWLRVVAARGGVDLDRLENLAPGELPYLGLLLKDPEDRQRLEIKAR